MRSVQQSRGICTFVTLVWVSFSGLCLVHCRMLSLCIGIYVFTM